jgi:signal peptidase I
MRRGLPPLLALITVIAVTGCGVKKSANGSIPIKTIRAPSATVTYEERSSSMEPTLHCARPAAGCEGDVADGIVTREPAGDARRADVVVFRTPPLAASRCGAGGIFVQRVIAVPGDTWAERDGFVYINGNKQIEPYVKPDRRDTQTLTLRNIPPQGAMTRIPARMYLTMGDNRADSCDSRRFGLVPRANIIGRVVQILRRSS